MKLVSELHNIVPYWKIIVSYFCTLGTDISSGAGLDPGAMAMSGPPYPPYI